jgi:hypothetical protein
MHDLQIEAESPFTPYTKIPASQAAGAFANVMPFPATLTAKVFNKGLAPTTNVVFSATFDNASVGSSSPVASIASGATSAPMNISTPIGMTYPATLGFHNWVYTVMQNETDMNPFDNSATYSLEIGNKYACDDVALCYNGVGSNQGTITLGNIFTIHNTTKINAVEIGHGNGSGLAYTLSLYEMTDATTTAATPLFTIDVTRNASGFRTINVPSTTLAPGSYYLCVNQLTATNVSLSYDTRAGSPRLYDRDNTGNLSALPNFGAGVLRMILEDTYTVTVSADPNEGGTVTGGGNFSQGQVATITATPNTGYEFVNWTKAGGTIFSTTAITTFSVNENLNLTANFRSDDMFLVTVPISPEGAGTITGNGQYTAGAIVILTASPSETYNFTKWTGTGIDVSTNPYIFTMPSDNVTITANFSIKTYPLIYNTPANGTLSVKANGVDVASGADVVHGTVLTITATPGPNYSYGTLTVNGNTILSGSTYTVVSATFINCAFVENPKYNLNLERDPITGGTVSGAGNYYANQQAAITATAGANYNFIAWMDGSTQVSTSASHNYPMPPSDKTLTAKFAYKKFAVTYTTPTNGTLSVKAGSTDVASGAEVDYNTVLTITASPNANYSLGTLTVNGVTLSNGGSYTVVSATAIVCAFVENPKFTLSLEVDPDTDGNSVTGAGSFYADAMTTISATAGANYNFVAWMDGNTTVSPYATFEYKMPAANKTLTAKFALKTYTVEVLSSNTAWGTVTGSGVYNHGASATVKALPTDIGKFLNWTDGATQVADTEEHTFIVTNNTVLIANFELNSGVSNNSMVSGFTIYPNPTRGELTIENGELTIENVEIYDITGRLVGAHPCGRPDSANGQTREGANKETSITIDVSHLSKGVYMIRVNGKTGRFVKE